MEIKATGHIFERDKKVFIEGRALTNTKVSDRTLELICKYAPNQVIDMKHSHPMRTKKGQGLGRFITAEIVEDHGKKAMDFKAQLFDYTKEQKNVVALFKKRLDAGLQFGISPEFEEYGDHENPVDAQPYGFALTDIPFDEGTDTRRMYMMEDKEKEEMEKLIAKLQTEVNDSLGVKNEFEALKKVKEESDAKLVKLELEQDSTKSQIQKEMDALKNEFENAKKAKNVLITGLQDSLTSVKLEMEKAVKKVNVETILDGSPVFLKESEEFSKFLYEMKEDWLIDNALKAEKSLPTIAATESMSESRRKAISTVNKEEMEIDAKFTSGMKEFAKKNGVDL